MVIYNTNFIVLVLDKIIFSLQCVSGSFVGQSRPALNFNSSQYIRYDDPEKQAIAAFKFLQEMTSSVTSSTSSQSAALTKSHDLHNQSDFLYKYNPMQQSTTSNEEKVNSPEKRHKRKVRLRNKKDQCAIRNQGKLKSRLSSTSNDESNDDISDSLSDDNVKSSRLIQQKMTYL